MNQYICPCCGYPELTAPAYADASSVGLVRGLSAPYCVHFGMPSYEVCPCCGFEFGNDDEPGTSSPTTFEQFLAEWISEGMPWFAPSKRPQLWSLKEQLADAAKGHQ